MGGVLRGRRCFAFSRTTGLVKISHRCVCGLIGRSGLETDQVDSQVSFVQETSVRLLLGSGPCRHIVSGIRFSVTRCCATRRVTRGCGIGAG